jgi:hypothetical protein
MRIYKYPLQVTDVQILQLPKGARVLAVQCQHDAPQLWALVNEKQPPEPRVFVTYGTGNPIPDTAAQERYTCTYQMRGGALVFHVFERLPLSTAAIDAEDAMRGGL